MLLVLLLLMLLLLFLPRSLFFFTAVIPSFLPGSRGFTRGEPLVAEKPTPFRNCGVHSATAV